jgi:hypothetical protein
MTAPGAAATRVVDVTHQLAPYRRGRVRRPVRLTLTDRTYAPEVADERSWIPPAFRAFARLAEVIPVRDLLVVGTANGLDALGAIEIFDLHSVTITDLFDDTVAAARDNIDEHLQPDAGVVVRDHAGDLLRCVPPDRRFCLVYENLPNIPAPDPARIEVGTNAASFLDSASYPVPQEFAPYLLALHYHCLEQARGRVRDGGGVLTSIGGRIPLEIAFGLHRSCGYAPRLVAFDVKVQTEAELIVPAYAEAERRTGLEFRFYDVDAIDVVRHARSSGVDGAELAAAVEADLGRLAISAQAALERQRRGILVAHAVFMIFGELHGVGH